MIKILIVEDDRAISNLIRVSLKTAGYTCRCAYDGLQAIAAVDEEVFDLILMDIMLPEVNGYELMEYIAPLQTPIIFLTAKNSVDDRVKGLRMGAEDYIVKPFEVVELLARVETVLRRYQKTQRYIDVEDVRIDTVSRIVTVAGQPVDLTNKEYELLLLFVRNINIALFRETIYERVWESEYMGETRTVDLHVQRLRKKLHWENKICAIYKVGYRLEIHS